MQNNTKRQSKYSLNDMNRDKMKQSNIEKKKM